MKRALSALALLIVASCGGGGSPTPTKAEAPATPSDVETKPAADPSLLDETEIANLLPSLSDFDPGWVRNTDQTDDGGAFVFYTPCVSDTPGMKRVTAWAMRSFTPEDDKDEQILVAAYGFPSEADATSAMEELSAPMADCHKSTLREAPVSISEMGVGRLGEESVGLYGEAEAESGETASLAIALARVGRVITYGFDLKGYDVDTDRFLGIVGDIAERAQDIG